MFEHLHKQIMAAAAAALPNELCAVIYDGQLVVCENVHPEPENFFQMSAQDVARYVGDKRLEAIVHSHPPAPARNPLPGNAPLVARDGPSAADMRQQLAMRLPWVLAVLSPASGTWAVHEWGDHTLELPILQRPFVHGVEDCYTLIRKWWWQERAIKLADYPRDDEWWAEEGEDLYMENFANEGFRRINPATPAELHPGDVFLMRVGAKRYNHGGVFVGGGLIAHHPPKRYSTEAPVGPYFRRIDVWLRRPE